LDDAVECIDVGVVHAKSRHLSDGVDDVGAGVGTVRRAWLTVRHQHVLVPRVGRHRLREGSIVEVLQLMDGVGR